MLYILLDLKEKGRFTEKHVGIKNLSEGADSVGGPMRGGKEYRFSGVTRVWRKGVTKRCSECAPLAHSEHRFPAPSLKVCRKPVLGVRVAS